MKIVTASNGKRTLKMSRKEWEAIGKKAGWKKEDIWPFDKKPQPQITQITPQATPPNNQNQPKAGYSTLTGDFSQDINTMLYIASLGAGFQVDPSNLKGYYGYCDGQKIFILPFTTIQGRLPKHPATLSSEQLDKNFNYNGKNTVGKYPISITDIFNEFVKVGLKPVPKQKIDESMSMYY